MSQFCGARIDVWENIAGLGVSGLKNEEKGKKEKTISRFCLLIRFYSVFTHFQVYILELHQSRNVKFVFFITFCILHSLRLINRLQILVYVYVAVNLTAQSDNGVDGDRFHMLPYACFWIPFTILKDGEFNFWHKK
jgi:hypothetical protein